MASWSTRLGSSRRSQSRRSRPCVPGGSAGAACSSLRVSTTTLWLLARPSSKQPSPSAPRASGNRTGCGWLAPWERVCCAGAPSGSDDKLGARCVGGSSWNIGEEVKLPNCCCALALPDAAGAADTSSPAASPTALTFGVPQKVNRRVHRKSATTSSAALSLTVPAIRSPSYRPSNV